MNVHDDDRVQIPAAPSCPRCGTPQGGALECPRCGVVFSKAASRNLERRPAAPSAAGPASRDEKSRRRLTGLDLVLALALVVSLGWVAQSRRPEPPTTEPVPMPPRARSQAPASVPARGGMQHERMAPGEGPVGGDAAWPADFFATPPSGSPPAGSDGPVALSADDRPRWQRLKRVAEDREAIQDGDVHQAEDLHRRYPALPAVGHVAQGVLRAAARSERRQGRSDEALRHLERLVELWPESSETWSQVLETHIAAGRWREAEAFARRALSAHPTDATFHRRLARSLVMQNRDAEAADVLQRALAQGERPALRAMLQQIEQGLANARGLARVQGSHFTLHLQGDATPHQGSDLLRFLERTYDDLSRTLDTEVRGEIPVLLYTDQKSLGSSGTPAWALGSFSHHDGRIRVGTADLQLGITPNLQETLTHEVVHALVAARGGPGVPRDINEGLAQYLSGNRGRPVVVNPRAISGEGPVSVREFYDTALSFVEFLIRRYGQRSMNDLVAALGQTSRREAFARAYGVTDTEARQEWMKQLP